MKNARVGALVALATIVTLLAGCAAEIGGTASRGAGDSSASASASGSGSASASASGSGSGSVSPGSVTIRPHSADSHAAALLLAEADMPGWKLDASAVDADDVMGVPDCLRVTKFGRLVKANAYTGFVRVPDSGDVESVVQSVGVAVSADEAKQSMTAAVKFFDTCRTLAYTEEHTGMAVTVTMVPLGGIPPYGDESHAYRITGRAEYGGPDDGEATMLFEAVRKGGSLMGVLYTSTGSSTENFEQTLARAVGKLP